MLLLMHEHNSSYPSSQVIDRANSTGRPSISWEHAERTWTGRDTCRPHIAADEAGATLSIVLAVDACAVDGDSCSAIIAKGVEQPVKQVEAMRDEIVGHEENQRLLAPGSH